jgi:hypothetical protein
MDTETRLQRLEILKNRHTTVHSLIEALEGENAPEFTITHQKKIMLSIKNEIDAIEVSLKAKGVLS